jgi:hypothetical protein
LSARASNALVDVPFGAASFRRDEATEASNEQEADVTITPRAFERDEADQ